MDARKSNYHHGDLRTALIEAALDIINKLGPQGLTIRKVAQRVGVSHAAPYRHFPDKDHLVLAVVERGFELLDQQIEQARADAGNDPLLQFAAGGDAYLNFALNHPAYYRVMFSGDLLSSKGNSALRHTSAAALQRMVADMKTGQQLGLLRPGDPVLQAIFIISTVHGFVSLANDNRLAHLSGDKYPLDSIKDFVLSAIFEGVGVQ